MKNSILPPAEGKSLLATTILPGLTMGLFLPLLLTRSISRYPGLLVFSIPAGLMLVYCFSRGLRMLIAKRSSYSGAAYEYSSAILSPLSLLSLSCVVFIVPIPAIPFFIGAIVLGLVSYRTAAALKPHA